MNIESLRKTLEAIRDFDPRASRKRGRPIEPSTADLLAFARTLAEQADRITMRHFRGELGTRAKADGTLVTVADTAVEALLREGIAERFPSHVVLGEEEGYGADSEAEGGADGRTRWIIDPIDGTHSYARGIPIWATLIGCERNGVVEVGVASAPALGIRWWAGRGLGAYRGATSGDMSGERIHVSDRASVEEAQVLYGSYRLVMERWGERASALLLDSWRQRGFGDFWGHCLVAEGSAEVMLEGEVFAWDIAALLPIIEEAGGRITGDDGALGLDIGHCITTNGHLHDEVLTRLRG